MIKFSETNNVSDPNGIGLNDAFREIQPEKNESFNPSSYWDSLFKKRESANEITEDDLLSEIYGKSESDFSFDFILDEDLEDDLNVFYSPEWFDLSEEEKYLAIKNLVDTLSSKMGIEDTPGLAFYDGPESDCGSFNPGDNTIRMNFFRLSDPEELVNTIAHEMRHAYQFQRAMNPETRVDLLYLVNFENYITPIAIGEGKYLFFTDYQDQYIEAEARAFANLFGKKPEVAA